MLVSGDPGVSKLFPMVKYFYSLLEVSYGPNEENASFEKAKFIPEAKCSLSCNEDVDKSPTWFLKAFIKGTVRF